MFYIKTKYFVFGALTCVSMKWGSRSLQLVYEAVFSSRRATHHKF